MDIELIKKTFLKNFAYLNTGSKVKHTVLGLAPYNAKLSKDIQTEAKTLENHIKSANTIDKFFDEIIVSIANVYSLKQQNKAKKGDFEKDLINALQKCKGLGNKYFDEAVDRIIERIEILPDDFYKDLSHYPPVTDPNIHPLAILKTEIVNFFVNNAFSTEYLQIILDNKKTSKVPSQDTVFYTTEKSVPAEEHRYHLKQDSFIIPKPYVYRIIEGEGVTKDYKISDLYPLMIDQPEVSNDNVPPPSPATEGTQSQNSPTMQK